MARLLLVLLLVLGCGNVQSEDYINCDANVDLTGVPKEVCSVPTCITAIKNHVKYELNAAFQYMYLGAVYGQYLVDRPGTSKFLLEAASEERSHAILMMDYLNKRGVKLTDADFYHYTFTDALPTYTEDQLKTLKIQPVLETALKMEIDVTQKIKDVVGNCTDDFHGADVFTNPILDEQHDGIHKLQGAIKTLKNLQAGSTTDAAVALAEYIFDHKLLNGEVM